MEFSHTPVLLEECMKYLITDSSENACYVDGTLGGGGHTEALLSRTNSRVIGIDRDLDAIAAAEQRLRGYGDRFTAVHGNNSDMLNLLKEKGIKAADGVLLDLGVSSFQLDSVERGFSYRYDARLDMRMDQTQELDACQVVNQYDKAQLTRILYEYGEEKWASRIAEFIIAARPLETTGDLVRVIDQAIPKKVRMREEGHSARRTFQAIRIEVNGELSGLEQTVRSAVELLKPDGRLCIITFHSLEDRIIKNVFRSLENPCICPPSAPICTCGRKPTVKILTKKPVLPGEEEIRANQRAHSAKLRVLSKL